MFISKVPVPPGILCKVVWANRSYCSNHVFWRVAKQCHLNQAETRPVNGHESSIIPLLHSFHRAFPVFYLCKKKHRIHRLSPVYDGSWPRICCNPTQQRSLPEMRLETNGHTDTVLRVYPKAFLRQEEPVGRAFSWGPFDWLSEMGIFLVWAMQLHLSSG